MAQLPFFKMDDVQLTLLQTQWRSILNPIIAIPILNGLQLNNISLINGTNTFPHLLGRMQQGWFLTDINGGSVIYRPVSFNDKTLTLTSSSAVSVNIWVY